ncbi:hypothetical protein BC941DRAFT_467570 [Chlamydoabsidia padenii]|nr:hypothetical protein BC941DRAFT_467570 [Chlamydoabsidia padenii]
MTSSDQTELDWALTFQVCEMVNGSELGAKEARKLLQKKMLSNDAKTQVLSLEILNALFENCQEKFKGQLAAKSFGEDLETLATQKATDDNVHSKLVQCLQNWVGNSGTNPAFGAICRVHELVMHGAPQTSKSGRLGVFKPHQSTGPRNDQDGTQRTSHHHHQQQQQQQQHRLAQPVDIMSDVELAKNNAQLFSQTLSFTDPTQEDITKNELIQATALILANGELVNTFKAYDDMLERRAVDAATINSRAVNHRGTQQQPQDETLINTENDASGTNTHVETSTSGPSTSGGNDGTFPYKSTTESNIIIDPFDPFADSNEPNEQQGTPGYNGSSLPPPLTPQKLHD